MTDIRLADISEYQTSIDARVYIAAGHTCLLVRAHNGNRPDNFWPARRDYLRQFKFDAIGFYQYVVASRSTADQARDFIATVGDLRVNEFVCGDSEEGSGSQIGRMEQWFAITDQHYGKLGTLYASESWFAERLGGAGRWKRPRWMAAYRSSEPAAPHELWQYNDHSNLPGISGDGGDGNLFHGTGQTFARVFAGVSPGPPAPPADTVDLAVGTLPDGRQEVFVQLRSGEVQHRYQAKAGGWVPDWLSLGVPGK